MRRKIHSKPTTLYQESSSARFPFWHSIRDWGVLSVSVDVPNRRLVIIICSLLRSFSLLVPPNQSSSAAAIF
jgi:hypothetical protein